MQLFRKETQWVLQQVYCGTGPRHFFYSFKKQLNWDNNGFLWTGISFVAKRKWAKKQAKGVPPTHGHQSVLRLPLSLFLFLFVLFRSSIRLSCYSYCMCLFSIWGFCHLFCPHLNKIIMINYCNLLGNHFLWKLMTRLKVKVVPYFFKTCNHNLNIETIFV